MPESLQQLLVTNFGLSPSGYTGSEGAVGYVGSGGTNGYTGSAGASGSAILISNIQVTNSSYTVLDDTAVDTAGGYIKISGSGFVSGCSVLINQTAATSVTFISSTEVRAQLPATTAGTYIVYLVNTSGDVAIRVNGVTFSATPTWVTGSGLSGSVDTALSIQLSASSATTYALQAGSSLPAGVTLSNVGLISGTVSGLSSNTVYNFTIVATDAELQDSPRSFALTITVGDPYFRYTTLLIPGASTTFLADASTNNFALTTAGSPKPSLRSPFAGTGGSTEFATGDSLTTPVSADFVVGSSDAFCLEFWVYYTSAPSGYTFMCSIPGTTNSQYLNIRTGDAGFSSKIQAELGSGFSGLLDNSSYTTSYLVNKWTHIALCRTGGVTSFFIDGTRVATRTGDTITLSGNNYFAVNSTYGSQNSFPGYMSNVRWVKGSAVYDPSSSTITVPTAPLTAVANTKLLILQSSQPVSNNVFLDSSVNNFAITRNGNTTQGTFSPYGENWSNYFDGSGDYLAATSPSMSGTWTVELWWFPTVSATQQTIVAFNQGSAGTLAINIWMNTSNQLVVDNGQVASGLFTSGTFTINAWNHVAVVRNGTTTTGYINGAVVGTNTFTPGAVNNVNVGRYPDGNLTTFYYMSGYISNLRVVTGTAVYTSAFTPSTTPLTAISGTSLLTCQSNRFIDNSTNNYAVTKFGDVSVQRFSPFSPSASYDAGTFGGSAYFDGNGDYLTTNYTMNWSTYGSYTLEFWVYHTTMSPANQWYFTGGSGGTGNTIFYNYSNGRVGVGINGTNEIVSSAGVIKANTWQHIAYTFNGTTTIVYVDGVQVASGTTAIYANSSITLAIGGGSTSSSISVNGYIANMRLSRSVIYSSAFTPPTAPVTAIASTNLLCNFTGGAIVDNTMLSNLETIGSAQISTTQSKFGGGSMYFNGSSTCTILASPNLNFGTGDFTIEMWVYSASQSSGGNRTMGNGAGASWGANKWIFTTTTPGNLNKFTWHFWNHNSGSSDLLVSSSASNNSTWTYVAITRSGNTFRMFVNGVIEATSTSSASVDGNIPVQLTLGNSGVAGDSSWTGYIDDLRITKGYARYTANFTPTTTAFLRQ